MSLYNYEKPWLFNIKGFAFLIFGLMAIIQVKYTLPILLLAFALLLGLNVFLRFGEVFMLKVIKNRTQNLVLGTISLFFIIWFAAVFQNFDITSDKIEASRISASIVIVIWLVFTSMISLYETIDLLIKKMSVAYVFMIDFLLTGLLAYFYYLVVAVAQDTSRALTTFGIFTLCAGFASLSLAKLLVAMTKDK
jgi:hypothetical protein